MDRNIPRKQIRARRLRRLAVGTGIALAVVLALCAALRLGSRGIDASDFESATVDRGEVEATVSASGTVVPSAQIVVSSPISSRILEVLHRPGDFVEAGTPLMTLDLEEVQAASANLADRLAMKELE
ncbi:MAG: HlyD family secretion protein, partial [Muribaculaceae bacterium]|nr:HlyD family secretion protein [Muribaculaceae bacterium]